VLAKSYARIHRQNLANFGVLPLTFAHPEDYDSLASGVRFRLQDVRARLRAGAIIEIAVSDGRRIGATLPSSQREIDMIRAGGLIEMTRSVMTAAG
jgi:aconitate hydratase